MQSTHASQVETPIGVSEAARIGFVSVDTIRRYADDGTLPSHRSPKGHRKFYPRDVRRVFRPTQESDS